MKLYLPSWNGDMRLTEGADGKGSRLTLIDPTPQERIVAGDFLRIAAQKKWWDGKPPEKGEPYDGKPKDIPLDVPISKASKAFIGVARPKDRTLTAVKFVDGKLEVVEGATSRSLEAVEKKLARAKKGEGKGKEAAAASVKRPTPCCPQCQPGAIGPATEVLQAFMTPKQHDSWARERAMVVEGHLSGHRYVIAHRHTKLAQRVGRICFDVDDQLVVHFHDWSVPPEEEVLAAKLIMENAEPWLRNEATVFGANRTDLFKNPFGDHLDGTESAAFAQGLGTALKGWSHLLS